MTSPLALPPESLRTARLLLRRPTVDDAAAIYHNWASVPDATRYLAWRTHASVEETATHVGTTVESWERGSHVWVLTVPPSDEPIGSIGTRVRESDADFGYVLSPTQWGRGFMPEAARVVVDWLFSQPGMLTVWANLDAENVKSERLLKKLGMTLVERFVGPTLHPNVSDEPRECLKYAIHRDAWETLPSHSAAATD